MQYPFIRTAESQNSTWEHVTNKWRIQTFQPASMEQVFYDTLLRLCIEAM